MSKWNIILKTPEQIDGIRKSAHLARATLKYLEPFIKEGVTTASINDLAETFIRDHGAIPATIDYRGYKHATCISINDVVCHGIPGNQILYRGDIVNVDVTTKLNGYFGDTSRMYSIEPVSQEAARLMKVTKECLDIGIAQCYPGNFLGNIGYEIARHAKRNGYSVVHEFCGHGVGLEFHEDPEVNHIDDHNSGMKLKEGMTFTIEPMINQGKARTKVDKKDGWTARTIDGRLSAQYEHTVLITNDGVEVLTDIDGEYE